MKLHFDRKPDLDNANVGTSLFNFFAKCVTGILRFLLCRKLLGDARIMSGVTPLLLGGI